MTIRCHFDGKVIVPDEPVELPVNQPLVAEIAPGVIVVQPKNGGRGTVGELRKLGFVGLWKHRTDITDSSEYARELRRRAEGREDQR